MRCETFSYVVHARPVSWQRTNDVRGRRVTAKGQRTAKAAHALLARTALRGRAWDLTGRYAVEVRAYYATEVTGDCDRVLSLPMDALEGVAYRSDRQVKRTVCEVISGEGCERVEVTVTRIGDGPKGRRA